MIFQKCYQNSRKLQDGPPYVLDIVFNGKPISEMLVMFFQLCTCFGKESEVEPDVAFTR